MVSARSTPSKLLLASALLFVFAALGPAPATATRELPPLNEAVVAFARSQRGKQVGDGSCVTLATEALRRSGAKRISLRRADGDYVWGRRIDHFKDALPGDILQFRDAEFQGKKRLPRRRWTSWHYSYPHHTAIVAEVSDAGKLVTVLHQNVGGPGVDDAQKKRVQDGTLQVDSLQKGWVRIYRPVPPETDVPEDDATANES